MNKWLLSVLAVLLIGAADLTRAQSLPGPGNSLTFPGGTNYIDGGTNGRGITNQVTAEVWIKTTTFSYVWVMGKYLDANSEDRGFTCS